MLMAVIEAKLVKQEQQAIDAQYEKKRKGAEVAKKMCVLHLSSLSRDTYPYPPLLP